MDKYLPVPSHSLMLLHIPLMAAESYINDEITADDSFNDEAYGNGTSTNTSYVSSIASDIRRGVEENGRTYPSYGRNMYGMPIDEKEQDRNDLQHCKFTLILEGRLHLAPLVKVPQKILDLGCGSGIWTIVAADTYQSAQVIGVDIAPIQPSWVPPNCQFEILDIEEDWELAKNSFDLIHARELIVAVRDWDRLFRQSLESLKPGGFFEVGGAYPEIHSDDDTIPENSSLLDVCKLFFTMGDAMGTPINAPTTWKGRMERAGFVDVKETVYKVPMGPWPKTKRFKEIGAFENVSIVEGLEAYMMRGYTQVLGGNADVLRIKVAKAVAELRNPKMHTYVF